MAKGKRDASASAPKSEPIETQIPKIERFSLVEYILLVLAFWAFCLATMAALRLVTGDTLGLWFFFKTVGISFSFVALFHWIYDLIYRDETVPEKD